MKLFYALFAFVTVGSVLLIALTNDGSDNLEKYNSSIRDSKTSTNNFFLGPGYYRMQRSYSSSSSGGGRSYSGGGFSSGGK